MDPLYHFLSEDVLAEAMGLASRAHLFHITALDGTNAVFRYFDEETRADLVLKFYGRKWVDGTGGSPQERAHNARTEFRNLIEIRTLGFNGGPHLVPRPYGVSDTAELALAKDHVFGVTAQDLIHHALRSGETGLWSLGGLVGEVAWFLKDLHTRSRGVQPVQGSSAVNELDAALEDLSRLHILDPSEGASLGAIRDAWDQSGTLSRGRQVFCVRDANFSNFVRTPAGALANIDVEAAGWGDYAYDLGCVAAELKHLFLLHGRGRGASEEFIRRLYTAYFSDGFMMSEPFEAMTERGRFFMGLFELRMARNGWLDWDYRTGLIREAIACLA